MLGAALYEIQIATKIKNFPIGPHLKNIFDVRIGAPLNSHVRAR
jgi:hypothetical protein